ncbi:32124_t:CDS:2, partial [Gigaspora margarita]
NYSKDNIVIGLARFGYEFNSTAEETELVKHIKQFLTITIRLYTR